MIQIQQVLIAVFLIYNVQIVDSVVCYQCTDCPEPFTETYPYVTLSNNSNFLAQCTKTVMTINDRRLISRGSVFFCPTQTSSGDVQIYCCGTDFCNESAHLSLSKFIFFLSFFLLIKIYL